MRLLSDVEPLEQAGVVVRMPAAWRAGRPSRPAVAATVGSKAPSQVGAAQLLDFQVDVSLDGAPLTPEEIASLLAATDGLALLRGQWVEVDAARLKATLDRYAEIERLARKQGVSFGQAMRLLAGRRCRRKRGDAGGGGVVGACRPRAPGSPRRSPPAAARRRSPPPHPGEALKATLRPYQDVGLRWLGFLARLGLGACLADDMGLGKTIQVLALLLTVAGRGGERRPSLIVAPASLLANWAAEAERFAPSLNVFVAHPAFASAERLRSPSDGRSRRDRSRRDELRRPSAARLARQDPVAARRRRRGAGDQESRRQADPRRQGARRREPHRAHRHAGREQSSRPVVDLRFPQSGPARLVEGLRRLRQEPRRPHAAVLCAAAQGSSPPTSCAG